MNLKRNIIFNADKPLFTECIKLITKLSILASVPWGLIMVFDEVKELIWK